MRTTRTMRRRRSACLVPGAERLTALGLLVATALGTGCAGRRSAAPPSPEGAEAKPATGLTDRSRRAATVESANTLTDSQFVQQPVSRVEELFIGRFPGVQVFNVNGQLQIRIRGASSFNLSTEPLILIDGQQMSPGSGGLIGLNPRDIRRIEVLKDAVSMAEFGARGSNGVIRITTKRPD